MAQWKLNNKGNCDYVIEEVQEALSDVNALINIPNFGKAYQTFKQALPQTYCERNFWRSHGISQVANLPCNCKAFIIKKIYCKGLGNDKFRATFRAVDNKIQIIEVYYKPRKQLEDKKRICKYCQQ